MLEAAGANLTVHTKKSTTRSPIQIHPTKYIALTDLIITNHPKKNKKAKCNLVKYITTKQEKKKIEEVTYSGSISSIGYILRMLLRMVGVVSSKRL